MYEEKEAILHAIEAIKSSIEIFGGEDKDNPSNRLICEIKFVNEDHFLAKK